MLLGVCDLRLDLEIFDLRGPTAADNSGTTDDCPDSMVVTVSLNDLFIISTLIDLSYNLYNFLNYRLLQELLVHLFVESIPASIVIFDFY